MGDTIFDHRSANSANIQYIHANWGYQKIRKKNVFKINQLSELKNFLENEKNFKKIIKSYKKSSSDYEHFFKSDHWKRSYEKKKELFKFKNLKNFRNNSLSFGLDTKLELINSKNHIMKFKIK